MDRKRPMRSQRSSACQRDADRHSSAGDMSAPGVRRYTAALSSGCNSHTANAPAGSNRSSHGGNELAEASECVSRIGDSASVQDATRVNAKQASKRTMRRPTRKPFRGRLTRLQQKLLVVERVKSVES